MSNRRIKKTEVEYAAKGLLLDFKELQGFEHAQISAIFPIYNKSGREIEYYEVKFSSPENKDNGYAIISATKADFPVVEFSEDGLTHYERFKRLIRGKEFRMIRFGPQYITAEDNKGELLAEIGLRPIIIPKQLRRHKRIEGKSKTGLVKLPRKLRVDIKKAIDDVQFLDYKNFKQKFHKPRQDITKIEKAWIDVLKPRGNPGCSYNYFWTDGYNNHPFYLQISANTPPNNTGHWSGCGPTAWMNIYGWHDLNWKPELLSSNHKYNDSYINALTMDVHDYIGTSWMFGQGFTWPGDMVKGYNFARKHLYHDYSYWYRYDWWNTDEEWVFKVARSVARAKRPFIVGYFKDWHYAIGYGIAECKTHGWKKHSWIRIYPAWSATDSQNKWIPKSIIFGIYGVYNFYPLLEFGWIENPQELEVEIAGPGVINRMYIYTGIAVFHSRGAIGSNWLRNSISFEVGRSFTSTQFKKAIAIASLASISNVSHAVNAGWAVDKVVTGRSAITGKTKVTLNFAIRDIDGYLHRIAYRVTVLAKL